MRRRVDHRLRSRIKVMVELLSGTGMSIAGDEQLCWYIERRVERKDYHWEREEKKKTHNWRKLSFWRSMCDLVARTGRHQQRYEAGCRLIAGYIPFFFHSLFHRMYKYVHICLYVSMWCMHVCVYACVGMDWRWLMWWSGFCFCFCSCVEVIFRRGNVLKSVLVISLWLLDSNGFVISFLLMFFVFVFIYLLFGGFLWFQFDFLF
jgi:hypothetical protein